MPRQKGGELRRNLPVRLTDDTYARLERVAREDGRSMSSYVRRLIEQAIAKAATR